MLLDLLERRASEIEDIVNALAHEHGEVSFKELRWWVGATTPGQLTSQRRGSAYQLGSLTALVEAEIGEQIKTGPRFSSYSSVSRHSPRSRNSAIERWSNSRPCRSTSHRLWHKLRQDSEEGTRTISRRFSRHALASQPSRATLRSNRRRNGLLVSLRRRTKLFTIGYNVTASRADDSYYDLLASEARLASFVGIAKGDVPNNTGSAWAARSRKSMADAR